jgi:hypothetical protein
MGQADPGRRPQPPIAYSQPAQRERKGGDPKNLMSWWSSVACAFLCLCADDCRCYTAAPLRASRSHDPTGKGLSLHCARSLPGQAQMAARARQGFCRLRSVSPTKEIRLGASMRRHCLSRPTWRPRRSDASANPSPCFHSHSLRSHFSGAGCMMGSVLLGLALQSLGRPPRGEGPSP